MSGGVRWKRNGTGAQHVHIILHSCLSASNELIFYILPTALGRQSCHDDGGYLANASKPPSCHDSANQPHLNAPHGITYLTDNHEHLLE
jgi:hypothetical protein